MEHLSTIIIAVILGLCLFGAFQKVRKDRKSGGCGCSNECPHCCHCDEDAKNS